MHTAIYARVSTDLQEQQGTIESQLRLAQAHCDAAGVSPVIYADDGVSGMLVLQDRPQGKRLLEDAKAGLVRELIVYKLDRLGRGNDARHLLDAVYTLKEFGVRVISLTEHIDLSTPAGELFLSMLAGFASYDRKVFLERTRLGKARAARDGRNPGGMLPFGYRTDEQHRYVIHGEEAAIIRRIYEMVADEGYTSSQVAAYLNSQKISPRYARDGVTMKKKPTAGVWHHGAVLRIIHKSIYKGEKLYTSNNNGTVQKEITPFPAIVTPDLWARAQVRLSANQVEAKRNVKWTYLLRGLLFCGECGCRMNGDVLRAKWGESRIYLYYRCGSHRSHADGITTRCLSPSMPGEWLERAVWQLCIDLLTHPPEEVLDTPPEVPADDDLERQQREIESLHERLTIIEEERARVIDLYRRSLINGADVELQLPQLNSEKQAIVEMIRKMESRPQQVNAEAVNLVARAEMLQSMISDPEEVPAEIKQFCIQQLVNRIVVTHQEEDGRRIYAARIETDFGNRIIQHGHKKLTVE